VQGLKARLIQAFFAIRTSWSGPTALKIFANRQTQPVGLGWYIARPLALKSAILFSDSPPEFQGIPVLRLGTLSVDLSPSESICGQKLLNSQAWASRPESSK